MSLSAKTCGTGTSITTTTSLGEVLRRIKVRIQTTGTFPRSGRVLGAILYGLTSTKVIRLILAAKTIKFLRGRYTPSTIERATSHLLPNVPRTLETCGLHRAGGIVLSHSRTKVEGGALVVGLPRDTGVTGRSLRCVLPRIMRIMSAFSLEWGRGSKVAKRVRGTNGGVCE